MISRTSTWSHVLPEPSLGIEKGGLRPSLVVLGSSEGRLQNTHFSGNTQVDIEHSKPPRRRAARYTQPISLDAHSFSGGTPVPPRS